LNSQTDELPSTIPVEKYNKLLEEHHSTLQKKLSLESRLSDIDQNHALTKSQGNNQIISDLIQTIQQLTDWR
jgi:hypothetical protein